MKPWNLSATQEGLDGTAVCCPGCHATIPLDDINVAKDLVLCRQCGKTWPFSSARSSQELADVNLQTPPKGVRVETDLEGRTTIVYHRFSPAVLFLIPFTVFWGGLSVGGIYGSQIKKGTFELTQSLFGLPFLLGTVLLCAVIAYLLFGRWKLTVGRGEGSLFVGVGSLGWRRRFEFHPGARVSLEPSNYRVNDQPQEALVVYQDNQKLISFGASMRPREVKLFVAAAITQAMR